MRPLSALFKGELARFEKEGGTSGFFFSLALIQEMRGRREKRDDVVRREKVREPRNRMRTRRLGRTLRYEGNVKRRRKKERTRRRRGFYGSGIALSEYPSNDTSFEGEVVRSGITSD